MSIIQTDPIFQQSGNLADFINALFETNKINIPIPDPITILLSKARTGMDAQATSASVKSRFNEIGIPQGSLDGGNPNVMEGFSDALCEEIVNSIQSDARVDCAIAPGAIMTQGANEGGPLVGVNAAPLGNVSALIS